MTSCGGVKGTGKATEVTWGLFHVGEIVWKCVCGKEMRLIEVADEAVWVVVIKPRWDYQEKKMNDQPDLDEHLR